MYFFVMVPTSLSEVNYICRNGSFALYCHNTKKLLRLKLVKLNSTRNRAMITQHFFCICFYVSLGRDVGGEKVNPQFLRSVYSYPYYPVNVARYFSPVARIPLPGMPTSAFRTPQTHTLHGWYPGMSVPLYKYPPDNYIPQSHL